jgi:ABC-type multidrug transport system fused ATPase/permease subunit
MLLQLQQAIRYFRWAAKISVDLESKMVPSCSLDSPIELYILLALMVMLLGQVHVERVLEYIDLETEPELRLPSDPPLAAEVAYNTAAVGGKMHDQPAITQLLDDYNRQWRGGCTSGSSSDSLQGAHYSRDIFPSHGGVQFMDVSLRYRAGLPLALSSASFSVKGGAKVGICGRTIYLRDIINDPCR